MSYRSHVVWRTFLLLLTIGSFTVFSAPLTAAPSAAATDTTLQDAFAAAAREFNVPEAVLLSVSYNLSRWEHHAGKPSTSGGYGVMHLVDLASLPASDAKGDDSLSTAPATSGHAADYTLTTAAQLLGVQPEVLKQDVAQNIRGGAALLATYAQDTVQARPAQDGEWYGAVAKYSGSEEASLALGFADDVYTTIVSGTERTTTDRQRVRLAAKQVRPNKGTAASLPLRNTKYSGADCPNGLDCQVIPAAYVQRSSSPTDYGNYDLANREADGLDINYIVIHDTETPYDATIRYFQNPSASVSSHYVLRASDGQITQMVDNKDVSWTAGNWYINAHSINFEHEGYAIEGASWYSEQMYRSSAKLVRYLADKYGIPVDRAHIVGHDEVPHPTTGQGAMHWDPGPFWDWAHYMRLVGAASNLGDTDKSRDIVMIKPNFATNVQTVLDCEGDGSSITQAANFVYVYKAPSFDAPLITNPFIGSNPLCAHNWGNKALTGQQFYKVAQQGDWTSIWFSGQQGWFYNPHNQNSLFGGGTLITPKAGLASIPLYGRAYPEQSAYPTGIPYQTITPIPNYSIPAGQRYVASDLVKGDYYRATLYNQPQTNRVVEGQTEYYQIFYNHRFAFVKASDVDVVSAP